MVKNINATKIQKSEQKIFATFLTISPRLIAALKEFARLNEIKVKTQRLKKYIPVSIFNILPFF